MRIKPKKAKEKLKFKTPKGLKGKMKWKRIFPKIKRIKVKLGG